MYKDFFYFLLERFAHPVELKTGVRKRPFTLYAEQGELWVKNETQNLRRLGRKEVDAFIARYEETESRKSVDYQDVTFHSSYLLAAMKYLEEKHAPGDSVVRFHSDDNPNSEQNYSAWISAHPQGYVLNLRKGTEGKGNAEAERFTRLHTAGCRRLAHTSTAVHPQPFTGNQYYKICADSLDELEKEAHVITALPEIRRCPCLKRA